MKHESKPTTKEAAKPKPSELEIAMKENPEKFEGYSGQYLDRRTGTIFALKIEDIDNVRAKRTHLARNATHFGDYTEEDFRKIFDKL